MTERGHGKNSPFDLYSRLCDRAWTSIAESRFAYALRKIGNSSALVSSSPLFSIIPLEKIKKHIARPIVRRVSEAFDNSRVLNLILICLRTLLCLPISFYATFSMSLGLYSTIVSVVKTSIAARSLSFNYTDALPALLIVALSIPLLFMQRRSLSAAIRETALLRIIFIKALGIPEDFFDEKQTGHFAKLNPLLVFFVGMLFGSATYIYPLTIVLTALLIAILAIAVLFAPESGVLLTVYFFSFVPGKYIAYSVVFTAISYVLKLIRGKRILTFGMADGAVLFFISVSFVSGLLSLTPTDSKERFLTLGCFALFYFLTVNLMISESLLRKVAAAIVTSSSLVGLLAALYLTERALETSFPIIGAIYPMLRVDEMLSTGSLAVLATMSVPFFAAMFLLRKTTNGRIGMLLCFALLAVFAFAGHSLVGAATGIVALLIFVALSNKKLFAPCFALAAALPLTLILIPANIALKINNVFGFTDPTFSERFGLWKNVFRIIGFNPYVGVGLGERAFSEVYQMHASGVAFDDTHTNAGSFALHIMVESGIIGLLAILAVLFFAIVGAMSARWSAYSGRRASDNLRTDGNKLLMTAAVASIVGVLTLGMTEHLWKNSASLGIFWTVIAICGAAGRAMRREDCFPDPSKREISLRYKRIPVRRSSRTSQKSELSRNAGGDS